MVFRHTPATTRCAADAAVDTLPPMLMLILSYRAPCAAPCRDAAFVDTLFSFEMPRHAMPASLYYDMPRFICAASLHYYGAARG